MLERSSRSRVASVDESVDWLSPEERATWLAFVLATGAVLEAMDRRLSQVAGINRSQFSILQAVTMAPGSAARMSDVAASLRFSPSRVSHAVARLERDGWVERRPDPTDGRGQVVALTEAGQQRINQVAPSHIAQVRAAIFDRLTPTQVGQLHEICQALLEGADGDLPAG
jgi:DNA-binding MarR family transcriptional regulator